MIKLVGDKLKQWDIDRVVEIAPRHRKKLETVRFWKSSASDPLTVAFRTEGDKIVADIPNILLKDFGTLTVEIVVYDERGNYDTEKANIFVRKREKPDDYEYSETDVLELGSGSQPDWNQNDSTKPDYVKNRTHWTEYEEATIEIVGAGDAFLDGFPTFAVGDTVSITVNGVEHSLVAFDDDGYATIGDGWAELDSGEGQYGWQVCSFNEKAQFFCTKDSVVSYTKATVHPIDEKYLTNTTSFYSNGKLLPFLYIPDMDYDDGQKGLVRLSYGSLVVKDISYLPKVTLYNGRSVHTAATKPTTSTTLNWLAHSFENKPEMSDQINFSLMFSSGEFYNLYLNITSATSATAFTATGYFVDNDGALYTVVYTQADGETNGTMKITKKS